jgi:hypothetical protein
MKHGFGSLDIGRFPEPVCRVVTCCRKTGGMDVLLMLAFKGAIGQIGSYGRSVALIELSTREMRPLP